MILLRDLSQPYISGFDLVFDELPDAIANQSRTNAPLNWLYEFDSVQVTGIDTAVNCSVTAGEFRVSADGVTYDSYSSAARTVSNNGYVQFRLHSGGAWDDTRAESLTIGQLSVGFSISTAPTPSFELPRFVPSNMGVDRNEITIFKDRENIETVSVRHDGQPIDFTIFDYFMLYGISKEPITSYQTDIQGDAEGRIFLDVSKFATNGGRQDTTLIGYSPYYPRGVVFWDAALDRASVTVEIAGTHNQAPAEQTDHPYGVRFQVASRTNGAIMANSVGFTVVLSEKGEAIENLSSDASGYINVRHDSLNTLGEIVGVAVSTSDRAMTGFMWLEVQDLTAYMT